MGRVEPGGNGCDEPLLDRADVFVGPLPGMRDGCGQRTGNLLVRGQARDGVAKRFSGSGITELLEKHRPGKERGEVERSKSKRLVDRSECPRQIARGTPQGAELRPQRKRPGPIVQRALDCLPRASQIAASRGAIGRSLEF